METEIDILNKRIEVLELHQVEFNEVNWEILKALRMLVEKINKSDTLLKELTQKINDLTEGFKEIL